MIIFSQIIANHYKLLSKVAARVAICGEKVEVESVLTSGEADKTTSCSGTIVLTHCASLRGHEDRDNVIARALARGNLMPDCRRSPRRFAPRDDGTGNRLHMGSGGFYRVLWVLVGSSGEIWVGNALTSQPPPHGPHQNPRTP